LPVLAHVARRAALIRTRGILIAVVAALIAATAMTAAAAPADAASRPKVVIVVGPAGSQTGPYLSLARSYAAQARSYGATVSELYTPHATWSRVRVAAQGANLFIYLGHGNGYPSPYGFSVYKSDGLGLNAQDGSSVVAYYGEYYVAHDIRLARNAVVILNHLCYAAGNSEPGMADPTLATARARADGFAAGFLRTNARAVFADGHGSVAHIIYDLFRTSLSVQRIFWTDPRATGTHPTTFASSRTAGKTGILDPYAPGKYYHSVVGDLGMTAVAWRTGSSAAASTSTAKAQASKAPTTKAPTSGSKAPASRAPAPKAPTSVATSTRTVGVPALVLRGGPSAMSARLGLLELGTPLAVVGSATGNWLDVRIPDGRQGWVAGAYTRPASTSASMASTTTPTSTRTVRALALALRKGPGVTPARLELLGLGTRPAVITSATGSWLYLRIPNDL
jgi:SH3-like domain-containing protein